MGNKPYRQQQWADRRAPHVAPVNVMVDTGGVIAGSEVVTAAYCTGR